MSSFPPVRETDLVQMIKERDAAIRERDEALVRIARLVGLLNRVLADCLSLTDRQLVEDIQVEIGEKP